MPNLTQMHKFRKAAEKLDTDTVYQQQREHIRASNRTTYSILLFQESSK